MKKKISTKYEVAGKKHDFRCIAERLSLLLGISIVMTKDAAKGEKVDKKKLIELIDLTTRAFIDMKEKY